VFRVIFGGSDSVDSSDSHDSSDSSDSHDSSDSSDSSDSHDSSDSSDSLGFHITCVMRSYSIGLFLRTFRPLYSIVDIRFFVYKVGY